jgi:hypothetical protein
VDADAVDALEAALAAALTCDRARVSFLEGSDAGEPARADVCLYPAEGEEEENDNRSCAQLAREALALAAADLLLADEDDTLANTGLASLRGAWAAALLEDHSDGEDDGGDDAVEVSSCIGLII